MGELLARIDSRELTAWVAYERVTGPVGPERGDILAAIVASVVANASRSKRGKAFKPEDFLPEWDSDAPRNAAPEQSGHEQLRLIKGLNRAMGGRTGRGRGTSVDSAGPADQDRH